MTGTLGWVQDDTGELKCGSLIGSDFIKTFWVIPE